MWGAPTGEDAMSTCVSRSDLFNSPVRRRLFGLLATLAVISASGLAVGDPAAAAPGTASVAHGDSGHRVWTKVLDPPAGAYRPSRISPSIRATHGAFSSSPSSRRRAAL